MSAGPLRRITAVVGLLALAPIAVMVLTSALTPEQAAGRAILVTATVVLLGNLARIVLTQLLHRVERGLPSEEQSGEQVGAGRAQAPSPQRRAEDRLPAGGGR